MEISSPSAAGSRSRAVKWKTFDLLLALTLLCTLVVLPAASALKLQLTVTLVVLAVGSALLFSAIGASIGLWLGSRIGWGAPDLWAWVAGELASARLARRGLYHWPSSRVW